MTCPTSQPPPFSLPWTGHLPRVHPAHRPNLPLIDQWLGHHLALTLWPGGVERAFIAARSEGEYRDLRLLSILARLPCPHRLTPADFRRAPLSDLVAHERVEIAIRLACADEALLAALMIPPWTLLAPSEEGSEEAGLESARANQARGPRPGWMVLRLPDRPGGTPEALVQRVGLRGGLLKLQRVPLSRPIEDYITDPTDVDRQAWLLGHLDTLDGRTYQQYADRYVGSAGSLMALAPRLKTVLLGEQPIAVDAAPWWPTLHIDDAPDGRGLLARLAPRPSHYWYHGDGWVVVEGTLRPVAAAVGAVVDRFQDLEAPWRIGWDQVASLLDALGRVHLTVRFNTQRIPISAPPPTPRLLLTGAEGVLAVRIGFRYGNLDLTPAHGTLVRTAEGLLRRDREVESLLTQELLRALPEGSALPAGLEGEAAHEFLTGLKARLPGWIIEADRDLFDRFAGRIEADIQLFEAQDWFRLKAVFRLGEDKVSLQKVLAAWRERRRFLRLDDGRLAALPERWLKAHGRALSQYVAAQAACEGEPGRWAAPLLHDLVPPEAVPPGLSDVVQRLRAFEGLLIRAVPARLQATLRPYQRRGFEWLCTLRELGLGGVLADDMGLGKTVQSLAFLLEGRAAAEAPDLVVAPTSVVSAWADQARRFAPDLAVHVHHGPDRRLPEGPVELVITSYALLRRDTWIQGRAWRTVVFDEAQAFKSRRSQTAARARAIRAQSRFAVTGTPLENHLDELWTLFSVVCPGLLGTHEDFSERFVAPLAAGEDVLPALRRLIAPFLLRRLKAEVAPELPPCEAITVRLPLSETHRRLYDQVADAVRVELGDLPEAETLRKALDETVGRARLLPLEALLRLRQAASAPHALELAEAKAVGRDTKRAWLLEHLPRLAQAGHKVLVFSQWTRVLRALRRDLTALGLPTMYLDGKTGERATLQARFNAPEGPPVFLISTMAGGTGLTLTGADHVVLHEPWWNPAVEQQAADRAHRIGQTRPVTIWRLVAKDTVEEAMERRQQDKQLLFAGTVESLPTSGRLSPASVQVVLGVLRRFAGTL